MSTEPGRYIVFDTESSEDRLQAEVPTQTLTLRLGAMLLVDATGGGGRRETWCDFRTDEEFHAVLAGLPFTTEPIYVFAHNIGFDVRMVAWWRWMGQGHYTLTHPRRNGERGASEKVLYITDCPPFIVQLFRPDGQKFLLLDSVQWLSRSLRVLGEMIGESKGEMPAYDAPEADWWEYCRQDVRVLTVALRALWSYLDTMRVPRWALTPAAQAMQLFRTRYEKGAIVRPEEPAVLALDRHAYYAGLSEAFRLGRIEGPLFQVDVASLYPAMMVDRGFPLEAIAAGDHSASTSLPEDFRPIEMTAEVWLDSPEYPFPVRGRDGTLWVTGKVRTILCGPELERAYCLGAIQRVGRWVRYRTGSPFDDYVYDLWARRLEARRRKRPLHELVCKALLNSLHGKFGQKTDAWIDTGIRHDPGQYGAGISVRMNDPAVKFWRIVAGHEFLSDRDAEDPRGFVPVAAWTSSYARCFMWDMIHTAGIEHTMHIATDSLIVDQEGLKRLQEGDWVKDQALGRFRIEGMEEQCEIYGANALDWGPKRTRPGIKKDAIEIAPDVWSVQKWLGFEADILRGNVASVSIETWFLSTSKSYSRREVLGDGSTRPWSIDNWTIAPSDQLSMPIRG